MHTDILTYLNNYYLLTKLQNLLFLSDHPKFSNQLLWSDLFPPGKSKTLEYCKKSKKFEIEEFSHIFFY